MSFSFKSTRVEKLDSKEANQQTDLPITGSDKSIFEILLGGATGGSPRGGAAGAFFFAVIFSKRF